MKATTRTVFRVLGALAAIGGGSTALLVGTWTSLYLRNGGWLLPMALVGALVGVVCGWLLRTWWAVLVVPVLFDFGLVAALALLNYQSGGIPPELQALGVSHVIGILVVPVFYLPVVYLLLVAGTAMGTGIGRRMDEQVAHW
jgi:hypothetical protein